VLGSGLPPASAAQAARAALEEVGRLQEEQARLNDKVASLSQALAESEAKLAAAERAQEVAGAGGEHVQAGSGEADAAQGWGVARADQSAAGGGAGAAAGDLELRLEASRENLRMVRDAMSCRLLLAQERLTERELEASALRARLSEVDPEGAAAVPAATPLSPHAGVGWGQSPRTPRRPGGEAVLSEKYDILQSPALLDGTVASVGAVAEAEALRRRVRDLEAALAAGAHAQQLVEVEDRLAEAQVMAPRGTRSARGMRRYGG
jgi:hypothetical protein